MQTEHGPDIPDIPDESFFLLAVHNQNLWIANELNHLLDLNKDHLEMLKDSIENLIDALRQEM